MTERRKTVAHYLNGLAVAAIATASATFLSGHSSGVTLVVAAVCSGGLHAVALWVAGAE